MKDKYNDLIDSYADRIEIRLKRQKDYVTVDYFDGVRLDPESVPSGKYMYHTRHRDNDMSALQWIVPEGQVVVVNFCGTIVSDVPLKVKEETKIMYVSYL